MIRAARPSGENQPLQQLRNRKPEIIYDARDLFIVLRLPGAVNGTLAEPGPETRAIVDINNCFSITGGGLVINSNPGNSGYYRLTQKDRSAGEVCKISVEITSDIDAGHVLGWAVIDNISSGAFITDGVWGVHQNGTDFFINYAVDNGDYFSGAICLRINGGFFLVKSTKTGLDFYKLVWVNNVSPGLLGINPCVRFSGGVDFSVQDVSVPKQLWLPEPLLSDSFANVAQRAIDYGGVYNGVYALCGLGGDATKAFFDDNNSYCNIYSAAINTKFSDIDGSLIVRGKVSSAASWVDGNVRTLAIFRTDANNLISISKTAVANQLRFSYSAGGVATSLTSVILAGSVNWFTAQLSYSQTTAQLRAYINGTELVGSPIANAGVWVGNLAAATTVLGASSTAPDDPWFGWLSDAIMLYGIEATPAQMATINTMLTAGTMTEVWLNSEFGVGMWSWWKLNESYISNGLGHAEGITGALGAGGSGKTYEQPMGAWTYNGESSCSFVNPFAVHISDVKTPDVVIGGELHGAVDMGLSARWVNQNNFLAAYHDGANAILEEFVGGVGNVLITNAAGFVDGDPMVLILDGAYAALYYSNGLVGTTAAINSALLGSTKHGLYTANAFNYIDNLTIYARGTNGEYDFLESF